MPPPAPPQVIVFVDPALSGRKRPRPAAPAPAAAPSSSSSAPTDFRSVLHSVQRFGAASLVGAAAKAGADAAVILGEDELAAGTATVKDLRAARQTRASSLDGVLAAVLAAAARNSAQVAQQP